MLEKLQIFLGALVVIIGVALLLSFVAIIEALVAMGVLAMLGNPIPFSSSFIMIIVLEAWGTLIKVIRE